MNNKNVILSMKLFTISFLLILCANMTFCESTSEIDFSAFQKAMEDQDSSAALSVGNSILEQVEKKYQGNKGYRAFKSKLDAAEFLSKQMQDQLKKATTMKMSRMAQDIFKTNSSQEEKDSPIAPAKSYYDTSQKLFSMPVNIDDLNNDEKKFLVQYYNLKLLDISSNIAKKGQALAIADETFKSTHDYVLVLPLLHASDQNPVNIDILPKWMRQPEQFDVFADSCLLHFGVPFHAMNIAKRAAEIRDESFSEVEYYKMAAKKCGKLKVNCAVDCLERAIKNLEEDQKEEIISLKFEIVQLWLDSENYSLAASQAQKIYETYPDNKDAGKAIWLNYYALSRANSINEILVDIDTAINDERCKVYEPKLMYIKWWALRRDRSKAAQVAVLELKLLERYGNDPMVAPILLSQATDLLASQNYTDAYNILLKLDEKFPDTAAASQAAKMMEKLKTIQKTN